MTTHNNTEPEFVELGRSVVLNNSKWTLTGYSKAGYKTGFSLTPVKILFDCGVETNQVYENILMTHVHGDHSLRLPTICNRHKVRSSGKKYNVRLPSSSVKHVMLYIRSIQQMANPDTEMESDETLLEKSKINLIPVDYGDKFNANDCAIEVLNAYHSIQTVGYGISRIKKSLKKEYLEMMNDNTIDRGVRISKLNELKKTGVEINETTHIPEIAFYCDSNIQNLSNHDEWIKDPVIVCECTILIPTEKHDGEDSYLGHTKMSQLLPIMKLYPDKKWILIHVSKALTPEQIAETETNMRNDGFDVYIF